MSSTCNLNEKELRKSPDFRTHRRLTVPIQLYISGEPAPAGNLLAENRPQRVIY